MMLNLRRPLNQSPFGSQFVPLSLLTLPRTKRNRELHGTYFKSLSSFRLLSRFGGSVVQASNENTEKGLPPTSGAEKHPISLNSSTKLLERVKRFGLPVVSAVV